MNSGLFVSTDPAFEFQVPDDWELAQGADQLVIEGSVLSVGSVAPSPPVGLAGVIVLEAPDWAASRLDDEEAQEFLAEQFLSGLARSYDVGPAELDGRPALSGTFQNENGTPGAITIGFIQDVGVVLFYTATDAEVFDAHLGSFDSMRESFAFGS